MAGENSHATFLLEQGITLPPTEFQVRRWAQFIEEGNGLGSGQQDRTEILKRVVSTYIGKKVRRMQFDAELGRSVPAICEVIGVAPNSVKECLDLRKRGWLEQESDYFQAALRLVTGRTGSASRLTLLELV